MDKLMLTKWKSELEGQLNELEKNISTMQLERTKIVDQLGAVAKLLYTIGGEKPAEVLHFKNQGEAEATAEFMGEIKRLGWSVQRRQGRTKTYVVSSGNQSIEIWFKFSICHEATGQYWLGINPDDLKSRAIKKGGVILLLGASDRYLCFSFPKLLEVLEGATDTKTGRKFQIRENSNQFFLQPAGTNKWIDVSSFYKNLGKVYLN
jgi:hypothetical protein